MPATVVFKKNYKGSKKGDRARLLGPAFMRFKRAGLVERVPTTNNDLKLGLWEPKAEKPKAKSTPKKAE